jgi:hypothetical protein
VPPRNWHIKKRQRYGFCNLPAIHTRIVPLRVPSQADAKPESMPLPSALISGAGIGLLSDQTGTGGSIFLSRLLLL